MFPLPANPRPIAAPKLVSRCDMFPLDWHFRTQKDIKKCDDESALFYELPRAAEAVHEQSVLDATRYKIRIPSTLLYDNRTHTAVLGPVRKR